MVVRQTYVLVVFSMLELLAFSSCTLEPSKCSEPTRVVIDIDEVNYTISFGVCEDDSSSCICSTADKSLVITRAHLHSDGLEHDLQYKTETFNVVLPEPGMGVGTYHYSVGCEYDCIRMVHNCHGKCKEIELIVEIVDFKLIVRDSEPSVTEVSYYANEVEEKHEILSGTNVTLSCSSGLNSSSDSTSLDLPVLFTFNAWSNDSVTKSVECSQSHMQQVNSGDWIVTRQNSLPYDCVLTIMNFGSEDVGKYSCAGLLPRVNSHYKAWSQTVIDLSTREQASNYETLIISAAVVAGIVLFLVLAILGLVYRVKKVAPVPTPYSSLTRHRSLTQSYGATDSTGELSFTGNVSCTATLVPSEASVPITDPELCSDVDINVTLPTIGVVPPSTSPQPPLLPQGGNVEDKGDPQNSGESLEELENTNPGGSRASTISTVESEGQEGRKYYNEYVDIDQPDGRNTPEDSDAPFDANYTCEHCGKMYRQNERLYYKRHIEHLGQRCPKFSQIKSNEERLDISIPPIDSRLGVPDIIFPSTVVPPIGKEDKSLEESGSDVNLHFLSESTDSSSNSGPPSTDPLTSSSGPPSSVGEEGQQIYNNVMHIQPATGNTPETSPFPIDPNLKCSKCGKEYRGDHRLYLVRHLNEDRCISCSSDEQRNHSD